MTDQLRPRLIHPRRPWPLCHKVCAWWGAAILAQIIAIALRGLALAAPDDMPADMPPSPSSTWSPECTAEDLEDGACLTWDDIREQPLQSEGP